MRKEFGLTIYSWFSSLLQALSFERSKFKTKSHLSVLKNVITSHQLVSQAISLSFSINKTDRSYIYRPHICITNILEVSHSIYRKSLSVFICCEYKSQWFWFWIISASMSFYDSVKNIQVIHNRKWIYFGYLVRNSSLLKWNVLCMFRCFCFFFK